MAEQLAEKELAEQTAEQDQKKQPPKYRRQVGTKETVGLISFEYARGVEIRLGDNGEWLDRILNISRMQRAFWGPIIGVWDIINDIFLATFVEKTRTRFGKFRPYLVIFPFYTLPVSLAMAMLPYVFWDTSDAFLPKILVWVGLRLLNDLSDTLWDIVRTGMLANITPDPGERISLITKAQFMTFGSGLPGQIFRVILDVVANNQNLTMRQRDYSLRRLFAGFGVGTMILGSLLSIFFVFVSKERVSAPSAIKERAPTIRESLQAFRNNRPLMALMVHEVLDGLGINSQLGTYTEAILNFRNFGTVFGIPGSVLSNISWAYVTKLRRRYSSKFLWIFSRALPRPVLIVIYFLGMIRTRTGTYSPGGRYRYYRLYAKLWPMIGLYAIYDIVAMSMFGTRRVIPEEIRNECIDYGEWKNGMRSEAMVGTLRGVPRKITGMLGGFTTDLIMGLFGFQTGEDFQNQNPRTADMIWAMTNIIPQTFALISHIPQFFYNINQKDREVMYTELAERRAAALEEQRRIARETDQAVDE